VAPRGTLGRLIDNDFQRELLQKAIQQKVEELSRFSQKYTPAYPEIIRLKREIEDLQTSLQADRLSPQVQLLAQNQPQRESEARAIQDQMRVLEAQIRAEQARMQELAQNQPQREIDISAARAAQEQVRAEAAQLRAQLEALNAQRGKLLFDFDNGGKPFLTELAEAGFKDLPVETIIKLAQGGVTGSYMRELKEAGFGDLKIDEIIEAAQGGVSAKDLKAAREYNPKLTLKQIIALKQGGAL